MAETTHENDTTDVGQTARRPRHVPLRGYGQIAGRLFKRTGENRIGLVAAGVAFFGLLAVFPALTALVAVGGLILDPSEIADQVDPLLTSLPQSAAEILRSQITDLSLFDGDTLGIAAIVSLALALYSASRGTMNLIAGLNVAYGETEKRNFIILQLRGLAMTVAGILGILLVLTLVAAIPAAVSIIFGPSLITDLVLLLRWPILFVAAAFGFSALYRFGPSRRAAKWRWITPGAVIAVILWVGATLGFSWYVQAFGSYNETFGALAGVVILLLWLWLTSFVLMFGAMIDAELEAQTKMDSTRGPDLPMGERGAVKADSFDGNT